MRFASTRWIRSSATSAAVLCVAACTRVNPQFGVDGGQGGDATSDATSTAGLASTTNASGSASGSASASTADGSDTTNDGSATSDTSTEPSCGDGNRDDGEECDDGPANRPDGLCREDCTKSVCGDGHRAPDEACDILPDLPEDGCEACELVSCNNGVYEPDLEACDPSAPTASLECTPMCTINVCGDGYVLRPIEDCDDFNNDSNDSCVACQDARCGDGEVQEGVEACDDGNVMQTDDCLADCQLAECGDGFIHIGFEDCELDDPRTLECSAHGFFAGVGECQDCTFDTESCTNCGNAELDRDEECDWGAQNGFGQNACLLDGEWIGIGFVGCTEQCAVTFFGANCCMNDGQPCNDLNEELCCSQTCDQQGVCGPG